MKGQNIEVMFADMEGCRGMNEAICHGFLRIYQHARLLSEIVCFFTEVSCVWSGTLFSMRSVVRYLAALLSPLNLGSCIYFSLENDSQLQTANIVYQKSARSIRVRCRCPRFSINAKAITLFSPAPRFSSLNVKTVKA